MAEEAENQRERKAGDDEAMAAESKLEKRLSRRGFLKASGALIVAGASGVAVTQPAAPLEPHTPGPPLAPSVPVVRRYPGEFHAEVPYAPAHPPSPDVLHFFTPKEARAVDAITARILPGDPDDPGAREAGVLTYIDHLLSREHGYAQPIYRGPPFARTYEGDEPPEEENGGAYRVIWVQEDDLGRYGYQSILTPREAYRVGVAAVDRYANERFGSDLAELSEDEQDSVLMDLATGEAEGFDEPSAEDFFEMVRDHTLEGMFADPAYGGNRNLVGWSLLDYPGAQRAYTPTEMRTEGHNRVPQSMEELHPFHPGQPANPHVILPAVVPPTFQPPAFDHEDDR